MSQQASQARAPKSRVRVALIGAGAIADVHLAVLREIEGVEIVALVDRDLARAQLLAARHGLTRVLDGIGGLKELGVELAHVLVPPDQHAAVLRQLFELSIGAYVEKPCVLSAQEALELARQARERKLVFAAHHNQVFHPAFVRLCARAAAGEIGRIEHVQSTWNLPLAQLDAGDFGHWMFRSPRNIVFEQGVHPLSQVQALLGRIQSSQAQALARCELSPGRAFVERWSLSAVAERGTAQVYLGFGQGQPCSTIRVIGSDGVLEADLLHDTLAGERKTHWLEFWDGYLAASGRGRALKSDARRVLREYLLATLGLAPRRDAWFLSMRDAIRAFYESLRSGARVPADGERAAQVLEWCEALASAAPADAPAEPPLPEPGAPRAGEVVVLGATGFIGRRTVDKLLAAGAGVTIVARRTAALPPAIAAAARSGRVRVFQGSLQDEAALARAFEGAEVVLQLATGAGATWEEIEASMVRGSLRAAELALAARVKRFVYVSSIAALDTSGVGGRPLSDSLATDPAPSARPLYARGKIAAEKALLELHKSRGLPLSIARPGIVVGAGTPMQHSGYGYWARDNHCIGWGQGQHPLPLVWVDDVAQALALLARHPGYDLDGQALNLCARANLSARAMVAALAKETGRPIEFHPRSLALSQALELGKWLVKKLGRRPGVEFPSWHDLEARRLDVSFACDLARERLGWRPVEDAQTLIEKATAPYRR